MLPSKVQTKTAILVLALSSTFWGLTWWPLKYLRSTGVEGVALILVSYGAVSLAFLPAFLRFRVVARAHARMLGQIALFGGVANLSFTLALAYGDVVRVMVLFYLLPLWGVLGGAVFLGEALTVKRVAAMVLALLGAFLVLGGTSIFNSPPTLMDCVATLSGFAFAMNNLCFRADQLLPVPLKIGAVFFGCAFGAALLLLLKVQEFPAGLRAETWFRVVAFGVFLLCITAGTQWGVTHLEAGRSSIIMILELLVAVLSTAIITDNWLSPLATFGAILIVLSSLTEARSATSSEGV